MLTYELFARQLAWPTEWPAVYGRQAPLVLEIGFGGGHFLRDLAQKRPSVNVLGIEISIESIRRGVQKLKVAGLDNGRVVQSSAGYILGACCAPASISDVYINFPDPWPKLGHQQRRLINESFLALLAGRMVTGGQLAVATDHADYAAHMTAVFEQAPYFTNQRMTTSVSGEAYRLGTKYESIAVSEGRTCHYFHWQRNERPLPVSFPIPKEFPMPHLVLQTALPLDRIKAAFSPRHVNQEDIHISYQAIFERQGGPSLLVETFVKETPLSQRVGLTIRQKEAGEYILGMSEMGFPRSTAGIQLAIGQLTHWLLDLDPQATVMTHNLGDGFN